LRVPLRRNVPVAPPSVGGLLLLPLARGQSVHESDVFRPVWFEPGYADRYGNTAAAFPDVYLLVRLRSP